jgi:hypothetical protein
MGILDDALKEIINKPVVEMVHCSGCDTELPEDEEANCKCCGEPVCEDCQAAYNQFTQIDYSCHQSCADDDRYRDDDY